MISYIKGFIEEKYTDRIIIDNNGIGYQLLSSLNTINSLEVGDTVKIFTKLIVKEDDLILIGFKQINEAETFTILTSVSKIGPKLALGILSFYTPSILKGHIISSDIAALTLVPGMGKKTAERLVLELKDKFDILEAEFEDSLISRPKISESEAAQALMGLGFNKNEAETAVKKAFLGYDIKDSADLIKKALIQLKSI